MPTQSEENYLKALYKLSGANKKLVATNDLADLLGTKPPSVTDMLQKLSEKKWVEYRRYYGSRLTSRGEKIAIQIVRRHKLWEVFLVEKLNFKWDEIHEVAEHLEHINHPKLTDKLDEFLQYPQLDPYGDPIPDKDGKMVEKKWLILNQCFHGNKYVIVGFKNHEPEFLRYLENLSMKVGVHLTISKIYEYDKSMLLDIKGNSINISNRVAENILVNPLV
jgi:DtxR family Mn-dependent transcriptional regulator